MKRNEPIEIEVEFVPYTEEGKQARKRCCRSLAEKLFFEANPHLKQFYKGGDAYAYRINE